MGRHLHHQQGIERYVLERALDRTEQVRVDEHSVGVKSLGVSHEIEEGIRKVRERLMPERPAEEEDSRKGPEEGRGSASLVQGSGMMSWTRHGKEKGNGGTEEQEGRRKDGGGGEGKNVPASHHGP